MNYKKFVNCGSFFVLSLQKERKLTMNNKEYSGSLIFDTYEKDFIDNESIKFCNVYCKSRV